MMSERATQLWDWHADGIARVWPAICPSPLAPFSGPPFRASPCRTFLAPSSTPAPAGPVGWPSLHRLGCPVTGEARKRETGGPGIRDTGFQRAMADGWTAQTRAPPQRTGFQKITNAIWSTDKIENVTRLPVGVTREAAVALLQNHDFFLECNPHHISHKIKPPDVAASTAAKAKAHYKLPQGRRAPR